MNFIGGSDARIIMGKDEKALLRLWQEKRGEIVNLDLSGVLIVQLGLVTEDLNRRWYELRVVSTWRNEPKPEIRQNEPNVWRMNSKLGDCALGESATRLCNNAETPPQQTETSKIGRYRAHPIRRPAPSGVCAAPLL
jgi:predicted phage-related endonuclease